MPRIREIDPLTEAEEFLAYAYETHEARLNGIHSQTTFDSARNTDEFVPLYDSISFERDEMFIRSQFKENSKKIWDSVFQVIEKGQIDILDHFIHLGLDINSVHPRRGQYPLFHAVQSAQTNMMRHLINLQSDVNAFSAEFTFYSDPKWGIRDLERARTPLMCACQMGNLNICKILCETAFADPMLIAPDGQTAQRLAAKKGHKEIVEYLPAHRGGTMLRLKCIILRFETYLDDYHHRWRHIRDAVRAIYVVLRAIVYDIPRYLVITLPWEIIKSISRTVVRIYKSIPPLDKWPGVIKRAIINFAKGVKRFAIGVGKAIRLAPKVVYTIGKYATTRLWKGIKAIPRLVRLAGEQLWLGLKTVAFFCRDLLFRFSLTYRS
jgi:hypothetical protein